MKNINIYEDAERMATLVVTLVTEDGMDIEDWLIHGQSGWESLTPAQLAAEYDEEQRTWRKE